MISAIEAHKLASSFENEAFKQCITILDEQIRHAAQKMELNTTLDRTIFPANVKMDKIVSYLQSQGYQAKYTSDQRDGSYIDVSWVTVSQPYRDER